MSSLLPLLHLITLFFALALNILSTKQPASLLPTLKPPKAPQISARTHHKAPQAPHPPIAPIATGKTRLYLLLPVNKKENTQTQAGGSALMMTANYTAK